jgi:radical SAM protein with 4Fe4S-binding SPASM domain
MGTSKVILTGGDPLLRSDLLELIQLGQDLGLEVILTPRVSPRLHDGLLRSLRSAGLSRLALGLDSPNPRVHDGLRGLPGNFRHTLDRLRTARDLGHSIQVDTTVTTRTFRDLEELAPILHDLGVDFWNLLFPIQEGGTALGSMLGPRETEAVFAVIHRLSRGAPFRVMTTEAPHFRRFALLAGDPSERASEVLVSEGKGMLFVDHLGEVFPSSALRVSCGNLRERSLADIYRRSTVFQTLRSPDLLGGKCGDCEFRKLCGGSRARAYARSGDWMEEEPTCGRTPTAPT